MKNMNRENQVDEYIFDGSLQDVSVAIQKVFMLNEEHSKFLTAVMSSNNVRRNGYEETDDQIGWWIFNNTGSLSAQVFRSRYVVPVRAILKEVISDSVIDVIMVRLKNESITVTQVVLKKVLIILNSIANTVERLEDYEICCYRTAALWQWNHPNDSFSIKDIYEMIIVDESRGCSNMDNGWDCSFRVGNPIKDECDMSIKRLSEIILNLCKKNVISSTFDDTHYMIEDKWYIWKLM